MEYVKKHYEKVALVAVLLGVAGLAFWLASQVESVKADLDEKLRVQTAIKQNSLPPADLTNATVAMSKVTPAFELELSGEHRTFNPGTWMKVGGVLKPVGAKGHLLSLVRINPLNLSITFTGVAGAAEPIRYQFLVERVFEKVPAKRRPITTSVVEGAKTEGTNGTFLLREVKPPKDAPAEVVIELLGERHTLIKDKMFSKVMGYSADLKSEVTTREFARKRQDETVNNNGANHKIISITPDEVILEAPNKTRSSLRLPSPQ
jgi:hypothetical protein